MIVPALCVGIQPVTLRVTGRRASLEAFPRASVGMIGRCIQSTGVVLSLMIVVGPLVLTLAMPLSLAASEEYASLLPMT